MQPCLLHPTTLDEWRGGSAPDFRTQTCRVFCLYRVALSLSVSVCKAFKPLVGQVSDPQSNDPNSEHIDKENKEIIIIIVIKEFGELNTVSPHFQVLHLHNAWIHRYVGACTRCGITIAPLSAAQPLFSVKRCRGRPQL